MTILDWAILAAFLGILVTAGVRSRRYVTSVSAFLAADRCGGRYLISVADGISMVGVISLVWYFEQNYQVGFTTYWWELMQGPAMIVMALSGWVIYRYRQTRAMTLAQFFEMRYSRRFRVFAGVVAFVAGIINFGIFPSVGAHFFRAILGLPSSYVILGFPCSTHVTLMGLLLGIALLFVFMGGQIAVMITDFLQGIFCNAVFVAIMIALLIMFPWERISETLLAAPPGQSLVDPYDLGEEQHFNPLFHVISLVIMFYGVLAWQGTQGYQCAAKTPHEAKMAGILKGWRPRVLMMITIVVPICVRTFLEHPAYAGAAAGVDEALVAFSSSAADGLEAETLQNRVRTPMALAHMLPVGLLGLFAASMLGAFITTHDTYLHSWGSIFIQDVVLPFRKTPLSPSQHLWLLRGSIVFVAVFIFCFSLLYKQTQFVAMILTLTGAIFFGGAGSVIIGGLYWKRGTTAAAWTALTTGVVLSTLGIALKQLDPAVIDGWREAAGLHPLRWLAWFAGLTGQEMTFLTIGVCVSGYVGVSLLGPRQEADLDRLLHRGEHAVAEDQVVIPKGVKASWREWVGITAEFTRRDRWVTYVTVGWPLVWSLVFLAGMIYRGFADISAEAWTRFWHVWTWGLVVTAAGVTVWFTIGGVLDMRWMLRALRTRRADAHDDGWLGWSEEGDGGVVAKAPDDE